MQKVRECPVPMMHKKECSSRCVFYGPFTNPKTGETYLSCSYLHKQIYSDDVASNGRPPEVGVANKRCDNV